jgi:hypothetical protein
MARGETGAAGRAFLDALSGLLSSRPTLATVAFSLCIIKS